MLRISLIVAIVMAVATLAVSHLKVAPELAATKDELDQTNQKLTASQTSERTAKKQATEARERAAKLQTDLETTQEQLSSTERLHQEQRERAEKLFAENRDLLQTKTNLTATLLQWEAFKVTPQQVREALEENKKLTADMEYMMRDFRSLERLKDRLEQRLAIYEGRKTKVVLPSGLRGKVMAVDPKYEFVVLNIGQDDGALESGEMLVSRDGKLIGRLKIFTVQAKHSIANILPEWRRGDIMEGDVALVGWN